MELYFWLVILGIAVIMIVAIILYQVYKLFILASDSIGYYVLRGWRLFKHYIVIPKREEWLEGLIWAENLYYNMGPEYAEQYVESCTHGMYSQFDKGARAYILHFERLKKLEN